MSLVNVLRRAPDSSARGAAFHGRRPCRRGQAEQVEQNDRGEASQGAKEMCVHQNRHIAGERHSAPWICSYP
ncbi:MAG: hypothetical protein KGL45_10000, partial [Gammaproteobacteria bacterium]|nr:hypothetical protein [Gammaproteobacteria bacterium]